MYCNLVWGFMRVMNWNLVARSARCAIRHDLATSDAQVSKMRQFGPKTLHTPNNSHISEAELLFQSVPMDLGLRDVHVLVTGSLSFESDLIAFFQRILRGGGCHWTRNLQALPRCRVPPHILAANKLN